MISERLFINKTRVKLLSSKYPQYIINNGVIKMYKPSPLAITKPADNKIWLCLDDLPEPLKSHMKQYGVSESELCPKKNKSKVVEFDDNTPILPIVGNLLPNDNVTAFTAVYKNNRWTLNAIVVCWDCHWSELFTGQTKYKNNVFCVADELSDEQKEDFIDKIITLGEVPKYLGLDSTQKTQSFSKR